MSFDVIGMLRAAKILEGVMMAKNVGEPTANPALALHKRRLSALILPQTGGDRASKAAHLQSIKAYSSGNPQDHAEALKLHHVAASINGQEGDKGAMAAHRQHVIEHSRASQPA